MKAKKGWVELDHLALKQPTNKNMNQENSPEKSEDTTEEKEVVQEENIGETRHDEKVTAKGIARSLLMANEPEQRMEVDKSDDSADS